MSVLTETPQHTTRQTTVRLVLAELAGLIVIPMVIAVAVNSWSAPAAADYIRMAFGTVASSVISGMIAIAVAIVARRTVPGRAAISFAVVAVIVSLWTFNVIVNTADRLVTVLERL